MKKERPYWGRLRHPSRIQGTVLTECRLWLLFLRLKILNTSSPFLPCLSVRAKKVRRKSHQKNGTVSPNVTSNHPLKRMITQPLRWWRGKGMIKSPWSALLPLRYPTIHFIPPLPTKGVAKRKTQTNTTKAGKTNSNPIRVSAEAAGESVAPQGKKWLSVYANDVPSPLPVPGSFASMRLGSA